MSELSEPFRSRWSPSVFADPDEERGRISDAEVRTMLTAAMWAPSRGNTQPWAFVVLPRGTEAHAEFCAVLSRGNQSWVPRAPLVIVAAARTGAWEGRDGLGPAAFYDLGQSVAHLTLQAQALGIASHQIAGFDHTAAHDFLRLPSAYEVPVAIVLGRPAEPVDMEAVGESVAARHDRPRVRNEPAAVVARERWGTPW